MLALRPGDSVLLDPSLLLPGIYLSDCVLIGDLSLSLFLSFQGKALGQMLLDFEIKNVPDLPKLAEQEQ